MPESPATRRKRGFLPLSESEPGRTYVVACVYERDSRLQEFLEKRGLRPGARFRLLARNYDQTVTLRGDAGRFALGQPAADKVWVAVLASPT